MQLAIVVAVVGSNIQWQWTPNGYAAAALGVALAFGATVTLSWILDLLRRRRQGASLGISAEKRSDQRRLR